ncbi:MAG: hypothetical protein E5W25_06680 [Mesorhizobium sp.]|nr:MAG: hypothetical protein E5W25_06680 [Mesorhizobium sp.]
MPDVERIAAELRAIIDHDASLGLKPPLHAEIRALLDELARQGEALKLAREALRIGQSYVLDAMRNDGGIENCEIGYRADFEKVSVALKALSTLEGK